MRRRHDDVLTDYVRERLDRIVTDSARESAVSEAALRTILRPRPMLGGLVLGADQEANDTGVAPPRRTGDAADPATEHPLVAESHEDAADQGSPARGETRLGRRMLSSPFTRQHVLVIGVVLAVGVLIAVFALTRARAVPVDPPAPVSAPVITEAHIGGPPEPAPSPTTAPIRIHVVGEVRAPGVHSLQVGARVADAIEAAGGLTDDARPGELNLAQELFDGQQVVIGGQRGVSAVRGADVSAGGAAEGPSGGTSGKVNLNTATAAQLDALPGVGPVTAEKIVAWRTEHRFTRIEELQEVPGIGPKTFAEIAPHVTV